MFLDSGFAESTLDDLVNDLRCSKMTLYSLAPSREQLILTVLRRFFDQASQQVDGAVERATTPEAKVRASLEGFVDQMGAMSSTCFQDAMEFATTSDLYEDFATRRTEQLRQLLVEMCGPGRTCAERAALLSAIVRDTVTRLCVGEIQQRSGLSEGAVVRHLLAVVTEALPFGPRATIRPLR